VSLGIRLHPKISDSLPLRLLATPTPQPWFAATAALKGFKLVSIKSVER